MYSIWANLYVQAALSFSWKTSEIIPMVERIKQQPPVAYRAHPVDPNVLCTTFVSTMRSYRCGMLGFYLPWVKK